MIIKTNKPDLGGTAPLSAFKTAKKLSDFAVRNLGEIETDEKTKYYLDIGCGNGFITEFVTPHFDKTIGIDILDNELNKFRTRCRHDNKTEVLKMSADNMSFPNNYFSLVTAFEVLEHVGDLEKTVSEASRVTKRGGLIIISVPQILFPFENHGVRIGNKIIRKKILFLPYIPALHRKISIARVFSSHQIDKIFTGRGFEVVGKPLYIAPQFERNGANGNSWENKLRFTRNILDKVASLPVLQRLVGVSVLKVYRKK
ncbi:MAG: class I SAM-dependent methyltransferase [Verrucomicrobiia bacterium]